MKFFLPIFLLFFTCTIVAQVPITGRIIDAKGDEPLIGATIAVKGTTRGTSADVDGRFRLDVPGEDAVLMITYSGYVAQEVLVGKQREINVSLQEDNSLLQEVVVVGYGSQKRSSISGAVSSINSDEIR